MSLHGRQKPVRTRLTRSLPTRSLCLYPGTTRSLSICNNFSRMVALTLSLNNTMSIPKNTYTRISAETDSNVVPPDPDYHPLRDSVNVILENRRIVSTVCVICSCVDLELMTISCVRVLRFLFRNVAIHM